MKENEEIQVRTLLIVNSCCLAESQCLVAVADPGVPRRVRSRQCRETKVNFLRADMENWRFIGVHRAQSRLLELGTRRWDAELAPLEIADRQACGVGVDEVAELAATIGENCSLILPVEELAVADEESGGDTMAERLQFECLEFAQGSRIHVGKTKARLECLRRRSRPEFDILLRPE